MFQWSVEARFGFTKQGKTTQSAAKPESGVYQLDQRDARGNYYKEIMTLLMMFMSKISILDSIILAAVFLS